MRHITPELRKKFITIYDKYAGMSLCPKIATGYEISIVDEDIIEERIMSKVTHDFQAAIKIAVLAQSESSPGKQDFIGYQYYYYKLYDYVTEDRFELKQLSMPDHSDGESEPDMYNGIDISHGNCYAIKLKEAYK